MDIPMYREEKKEYQLEQILDRIDENGGIIRTSEIVGLGIDFRRIRTFAAEGSLRKIRNGVYTAGKPVYTEEDLIRKLFPDGILTMETALFYYGYLENRPPEWRIAVNKNTSKARFAEIYPPVIPYYTDAEAMELGAAELGTPAGKTVRIFSKERIICDVLKYRDRMDPEDFRKAVRAYISDPEKDIASLMETAVQRRVRKKVQDVIGAWI